MKNQNNRRVQTLLPAAIAIIFFFGASVSTFALEGRKTNNNNIAFNPLSSNAGQGSLFETEKEFDLLNVHSNDLFSAVFRTAVDYPKPDFSEMEKWYEIVKYEYDDIAGGKWYLYYWVKLKADTRPDFYAWYYDKDGVGNGPWAAGCPITADGQSHIGETVKCYANTPSESVMDKTVRVKFIRIKY